MLTKDDLFTQNCLPHISDISLQLYKDFSVSILLQRCFHYYFTDGTDIIVKFKEHGIYHMLSIQHIDYTIPKNDFFNQIDAGLSFSNFTNTKGIKKRFNNEKERITMFSCIYDTLYHGKVFYVPNRSVPNTISVKSDYLIYNEVSGKGLNVGVKYENGFFMPFTILVSKSANLTKYTNGTDAKIVRKLIITDINTSIELDNIVYSNNFIIHTI